jgi:hypothetical protein
MREYVESVSDTDCTAWPFARLPDGRAFAYNCRRKRCEAACRTTWELLHGQAFPEGMQARHTCGNGNHGCVNPLHIVPGTAKENAADRRGHGRNTVGSRHGRATIDEEDVYSISRLGVAGQTPTEIARALGLSLHVVQRVWRGDAWQSVDVPRAGDVTRACRGCQQPLLGRALSAKWCSDRCRQRNR